MKSLGLLAFGIAILAASSAAPAQGQATAQLTITEKDDAYDLAVPVSRLVLTIPKGRLVSAKPGAGSESPRYFHFEDREKGLAASGWFEPEGSFRGMEEFWAGERASMSRRGLDPQNVAEEHVGKWSAVFYDIGLPGGRSANVRAEWVQAGTWIDLHVSLTADQPADAMRSRLREFVTALRVVEKSR